MTAAANESPKNAPKKLTWLGHNCFLFEYGETKFLIDPFLPNGLAPKKPSEIDADYVLVSHGHADHCADALEIAKRCGAPIIAVAELAGYFGEAGAKTEALNVGGAIYVPVSNELQTPKAQVLAVQAPHSSTTPDGKPGGTSLGFVLSFSQNGEPLSPNETAAIKPLRETLSDAVAFSIYFACDAGFFAETTWIGKLGIDVAVLPIGDRYATGPAASLDVIREVKPRYVIPCHFNTWPPIAQNADRWRDAVVKYASPAQPLVTSVGQTIQEDKNGAWN